jgi:hypothetical protein
VNPVITIEMQEKTGTPESPPIWTPVAGASVVEEIQSCSFSFITNGLYGEAGFRVPLEFNEVSALALSSTSLKRAVFKLNGAAIFYALVKQVSRSWSELQVRDLQLVGPTDGLEKTIVKRKFVPPGGQQDLSWFYYQLARDFIIPRGFADTLSIEVIGIQKESITFDGTLRECVTDLGTLGGAFIYWGFELQPDGTTVFFVRKRDDDTSPLYEPEIAQTDYFTTYNEAEDRYLPVVTGMEHVEEENAVNTLFIEGGEIRFPNFVKNPSFEEVAQGAAAASNMVVKGDFEEDDLSPWVFVSGASAQSSHPAHSGERYIELDHVNEIVRQTVSGIIGDSLYGVRFYSSLETPAGDPDEPYELFVRFLWYKVIDGVDTLITFNVKIVEQISATWIEHTIKFQSPALATKLRIEFEAATLPDGEGTDRGILIDDVIVFPDEETFQTAWRIESTEDPEGTDTNAPAAGLYTVDWTTEYSADFPPASPNYGAFAITLNAFGKTGLNAVRLIAASDGEFEVQAEQFYTLAFTGRATQQDGTAPGNGFNMRLGIVYKKEDPEDTFFFAPFQTRVGSDWQIAGFQFQMPEDARVARVFLEPLEPLIFYLDGIQFNQSPTLPDDFTESSTFATVITVKDVYPSNDPRYTLVDPPPVGVGPMEEKISNPAVRSKADAIELARPIFDARSKIQSSGTVAIVQTDTPVTLFRPNGYVRCQSTHPDMDDFVFPKLWPIRVSYEWSNKGLVAAIELEKEEPRLENILTIDRGLSIVSVGTAGAPLDTYVSPVSETILVEVADPRLVVNGDGTFTFTVTTTKEFKPSKSRIEIAIRGQDIPDDWFEFEQDGENGPFKILVITVPADFTIEAEDQILLYYHQKSGVSFLRRVDYFTSVTGGSLEEFVLTFIPLIDSLRVYVRGLKRSAGDFNLLINPDTGAADRIAIEAALDLLPGDEVTVVYEIGEAVFSTNNRSGVLDSSGFIDISAVYQYDEDDEYAVLLAYSGLVRQHPVITSPSGNYRVAVPTDRVGDRYLIRESTLGF